MSNEMIHLVKRGSIWCGQDEKSQEGQHDLMTRRLKWKDWRGQMRKILCCTQEQQKPYVPFEKKPNDGLLNQTKKQKL